MRKLNGLDLFSGIGGISLALHEWVNPIAYCESDKYCQSVLLSRMHAGDIGLAPIWDDVRTLRRENVWRSPDIIYGGFPCQDISVAGAGKGLSGARSGLFYEALRLCKELRPRFIFLENVPAIRTRGAAIIAKELASLGYDFKWNIVSAAEVGAPHLRKRWFLLAHASSNGRPQWGAECKVLGREAEDASGSSLVGNAHGEGSQGSEYSEAAWKALAQHRHSSCDEWPSWLPEPSLPRGHHGLRHRVDRTVSLGNGVVRKQVKVAFKLLIGLGEANDEEN